MFTRGFRCLTCGSTQPRSYDGYVCRNCGGNLEVTYDYELLKSTLHPDEFFFRLRKDIFRYLHLLPVQDLSLAPRLRVGITPLYRAKRLGNSIGLNNVFVKDEGQNPSGSFKDRASAVAITRAREMQATVVAAASTGNAGSSMACMAANVGVPCVVFVPETAPPAKLTQLLVFGARVIAVRGSYDDAFDLCVAVCEERGWFNRNTGLNPYTREGKKTCSFEIFEQLRRTAPDRILVPTGDGNIISGIWKGWQDLHSLGLVDRLPKIDCIQAKGSAAICNTVHALREKKVQPDEIEWSNLQIHPVEARTVADSISVDKPRDGLAAVRAVMESGGEAVTVEDKEILAAVPEVAGMTGVFAEPSAAAVWAGLKKMSRKGMVSRHERIVCLLTGSGMKDIAAARRASGEPFVVDPDPKSIAKTLKQIGL
ncbi:MAG: threonine synthase [Verrucomicrobia bacterium]|nr:threonine synthase [Verrucomicrobiota bacterium]